jgi:glycosyl transferase family 25
MLVLINLDTAAQRRGVMTRQIDACGCAFERVGIDLRCVRETEVDAQIQRCFAGLRFHRKALSNAEIGCWLSHLSAWRRLLQEPSALSATIIEDDLTLAPGFAHAVRALEHRSSLDVIYLGTSSRNISQRRRSVINGLDVHEPLGVIYNTWGYNITRAYAARFFAGKPGRIDLPIDHFLGGRGGKHGPSIGVLQPAVVHEDPMLAAASQIGPHTHRWDRSRLFQEARRRLLASPVSGMYYALYRYL